MSPRPGASTARPTSELLGSGSYQTPEGTRLFLLSPSLQLLILSIQLKL